jgi:hypothetical protein
VVWTVLIYDCDWTHWLDIDLDRFMSV